MDCHRLGPSELPHTSRLYRAYLEDFTRVRGFYAHPPTEQGILEAVRENHTGNPDQAARRILTEVLQEQNQRFGAGEPALRNIERLANGAVAVVTGQQVGLFSGPSYSFYKALSVIRVAEGLTEQGVDAVPVFWLATEDHDLAEVNHCLWLSRRGLERLELPITGDGRRVGEMALGAAVTKLALRATDSLEGPAAEDVRSALVESYGPKESFGSAFGKLMARLVAPYGLILLDPLDARLHRLAGPVYRRALEEHEALSRELLARSKQLERARFHAQVKVAERRTLLFLTEDHRRVPVRLRNDSFVAGQSTYSRGDISRLLAGQPEQFSPNVLLRPVIQDTLLPTAAYLAGPAEIAYFAQAEVVYRRLLGRMPAILPRAGFTLVEPHVARLLKKYGLDVREVIGSGQALRAKMERQYISRALAGRFEAGEKGIRKVLVGLKQPLRKLDKTLVGALGTTERKMLYQFERLREKAGRAQNFRTGVLDAHLQQLTDALYPHRGLQERSLCFLPFLARHGPRLIEELMRRVGAGAEVHQVVCLEE